MPKYNRFKKDTAERSAFEKENRGKTASGQKTPKKGMRPQEAPGKERSGASEKGMYGKENKRQDIRKRPMPGHERMEEKHSMEETHSIEKK